LHSDNTLVERKDQPEKPAKLACWGQSVALDASRGGVAGDGPATPKLPHRWAAKLQSFASDARNPASPIDSLECAEHFLDFCIFAGSLGDGGYEFMRELASKKMWRVVSVRIGAGLDLLRAWPERGL
jgi:hypothetical protein